MNATETRLIGEGTYIYSEIAAIVDFHQGHGQHALAKRALDAMRSAYAARPKGSYGARFIGGRFVGVVDVDTGLWY